MGNVVKVNINGLRSYADAIDNVNTRLAKVDRALDALQLTNNVNNLRKIVSADWNISWSSSLHRCSEYLRKTAEDFERVENYLSTADPRSFQKPCYDIVSSDNWRDKIGNAVKVKVSEVVSRVSDTYNAIKKGITDAWKQVVYSYQNGGFVYKAVQVGKKVVKISLAAVDIVCAVAEIGATGGLATPIAIIQIIDAVNDLASGSISLGMMFGSGDYSKDINLLRSAAGGIGGAIGGDLGKAIGETAYDTFSFGLKVKDLPGNLKNAYDLIRSGQLPETVKNGYTALKNVAQLNIGKDFIKNSVTAVEKLEDVTKAFNGVYSAAKTVVVDLIPSVKDVVGDVKNVAVESIRTVKSLYGMTIDRIRK